jgi:hypothetical protein
MHDKYATMVGLHTNIMEQMLYVLSLPYLAAVLVLPEAAPWHCAQGVQVNGLGLSMQLHHNHRYWCQLTLRGRTAGCACLVAMLQQ